MKYIPINNDKFIWTNSSTDFSKELATFGNQNTSTHKIIIKIRITDILRIFSFHDCILTYSPFIIYFSTTILYYFLLQFNNDLLLFNKSLLLINQYRKIVVLFFNYILILMLMAFIN
jgi:hypothetical protein